MKPVKAFRLATWCIPLGVLLAAVLCAALIAQISLDELDSLTHWHALWANARPYLLLWRLVLYAVIAGLWWRLQGRCADVLERAAWWRIGFLSLALILVIECSRLQR